MSSGVMQEGMEDDALVRALAAGRATLLLGQRHSPGLLNSIKRDIAAITGQTESGDLVRLLSAVGDDSSLERLRRAFEIHAVDPEMVAVADNPWSFVLTSAVDPQVHEAFQRPASARQLRVLFAGHAGTLTRSRLGTLTLLRLFGALEERESAYRPPTSDLELRKRSRLELALVLNELPLLIGPGGHVAVVGVGSDDWLDVEDLALSCADVPDGSIHWFATPEAPIADARLRALFGDRLRFYSQPLPTELRTASTGGREALERARQEFLHPASRSMTVRSGDRSAVVTFPPEEWRRLAQVAVVLDDGITERPPLAEEEERLAFRDFLHRVQRVPDWSGVARGFLFERGAASTLLELVEGEIGAIRSVHASDARGQEDVSRRSTRLPIVIEGAPASGKSRLLHWLAYQLKLRGHVVIYVLPSRGRTLFEQVERVCRLLERKTRATCVVIADDLDANDYEQLSEVLASSGRRSVLVGATNALRARTRDTPAEGIHQRDILPPSYRPSYRPFPLTSSLTDEEADRFLDFLADRGFPEIELARDVVRRRLFLLLLYRLLPYSRGNIHLSVGQEYERLASTLERYHAETDEAEIATDWKGQLDAVRAELFPGAKEVDFELESSPFHHERGVVHAVQLALFCSQIERPLSLDLLLRTQSAYFLKSYQAFSRAMEETALLQETTLDADGTIGVEAEHPFVAEVTLRSLVPDRAAQLGLISPLLKAVRWEETAFPGENPDQDYAVSVLQVVGPRGPFGDRFDQRDSLEQLVELLGEVRAAYGARLPQLLLLEANALRLIANWADSSFQDSMTRCGEAIVILADAEQILADRRPSGARNAQLQNVLTTRAVVHGFMCGACLREYRHVSQEERSKLREMLKEHLDDVNRTTTRARSMGRASYFPLDVSFWAHRDQLEQLPDLSDEERVSLLSKLESVLEVAVEEPIETGQYSRYQGRVADLAQLQGDIETVEAVAAELRAKGDFSADCILARRKAVDPGTRTIKSPQAALGDLLAYAPVIFGSDEALALMHRLWLGAQFSGQMIGGVKPVFARCTRDDWTLWRRILEGRLAFPANEANPYLNFCLAWTLLSLDEPLKAVQVLRANVALAIGNRRRVGTLAVVTDQTGAPIEYSGNVRRLDGQEAVLYVPRVLSEIRAPARVQAELAVSVHVGDEWHFGLGLNYQGLLPVPLPS
jgi:hypothetical protein